MSLLDKALASSVNPEELSLTVKGLLVAAVPVAMIVVRAAGHNIDQSQLQAVVEASVNVVAALGALASSVMVAIGVIRKLVRAFKS